MATYLEVINRVLVALGQADDLVDVSATSITDAYHLKIAQFVNDILEDVEAAAQWRTLRQRDSATIAANANSATLALSNERSRVFRVQDTDTGELVPLVFDVTDTANQKRLIEMDFAMLLFLDQDNSNVASSTGPSHFALSASDDSLDVYVWPRSTVEVDLELDMIVPQARLDSQVEADLDTNIKVPTLQVVLGATWWAQEDRGEELGPNAEKSELRYQRELSNQVAAENAAQGFDDLVPT